MVEPSRTFFAITAVLLLSLGMLPVGQGHPTLDDDDAGSGTDAGDSRSEAMPIDAGEIQGRLTLGVDRTDWYVFDVPAGHGYSVSAPEQDVRVAMEIPIYGLSDVEPGIPERWRTNDAITMHVWVGDADTFDISNDYTFTLEIVARPQDDAGSGGDADALDYPWEPIPDGTSTGILGDHDMVDLYTLEVTGTERITVRAAFDAEVAIALGVVARDPLTSDMAWGTSDLEVSAVFTDQDVTVSLGWGFVNWEEDQTHILPYDLTVTRESVPPGDTSHLPDLAVTRLQETREPWRPTAGFVIGDAPEVVHERHVFEMDVTNEGGGGAQSLYFVVEFHGEKGDVFVVKDSWSDHDALGPGETRTVVFEWDASYEFGAHTVDAEVRLLVGEESDETNNHATLATWARMEDSPVTL